MYVQFMSCVQEVGRVLPWANLGFHYAVQGKSKIRCYKVFKKEQDFPLQNNFISLFNN